MAPTNGHLVLPESLWVPQRCPLTLLHTNMCFLQPKKARSQPQAKPKATNNKHRIPLLGLPVVPFSFFGCEGSPTKTDYRKKSWYPYSNLSTGGPTVDKILHPRTPKMMIPLQIPTNTGVHGFKVVQDVRISPSTVAPSHWLCLCLSWLRCPEPSAQV